MTRGRLDAQVTVPSGGWSVALTITAVGGPFTVTVAAGNYYASSLVTAFETALDAASGADGDFTVSISDGESGTGLMTISHTVQTFSWTWTHTAFRNWCGFTGNNTPAASSFTGTEMVESLWLPNCEIASTYGNGDEGHTETDFGSTESPRGDVRGLVYNTRQVLPSVRWSHVPKANARIAAESVSNSSFERWWRNTQGGELSYFEPGSPFRLYWDAGSGTYKTYRIAAKTGTEMNRSVEEWDGLYAIELARLIRVPGT